MFEVVRSGTMNNSFSNFFVPDQKLGWKNVIEPITTAAILT